MGLTMDYVLQERCYVASAGETYLHDKIASFHHALVFVLLLLQLSLNY